MKEKANKQEEQEYFTQSALLEQGWTKGLISKFFPEPDAQATNPKYRGAAPVKLYSVEKVNAVIQTEEYRLAREKVEKRKLAAKKAVNSKRANSLAKYEKDVEKISVERIPLDKLRTLALDDKQDWYDLNLSERFAYDADENTVRRWMVNYVRHNMTMYDNLLIDWKGLVGIRNMYVSLHAQVLDKIAKVYPELHEECERQKNGTEAGEYFDI